jgi:hypothetical protein
MQIRPYEERDLDALRHIHAAQGFSYPFPNLQNPLFLTKLVLTSGRDGAQPFAPQGKQCCAPAGVDSDNTAPDEVHGAAFLRLTAEAFLLLDPKVGTPRERWEWLLHLHAATEQEAQSRGLEDVHAWLPPEIASRFGKRLTKLGWIRDDTWTPYCKRLR